MRAARVHRRTEHNLRPVGVAMLNWTCPDGGHARQIEVHAFPSRLK